MTSTIVHFAFDAAQARDYGHCRELLAGMHPDEVRAARTTALAFAAQCDVVTYTPRDAVPAGVVGWHIGGATR